jgi:hypothetical protein
MQFSRENGFFQTAKCKEIKNTKTFYRKKKKEKRKNIQKKNTNSNHPNTIFQFSIKIAPIKKPNHTKKSPKNPSKSIEIHRKSSKKTRK